MEMRRLTQQEFYDFPTLTNWNNALIDTNKYHVFYTAIFELNKEAYDKFTKNGIMTIEYKSKYYAAY